MSILSRDNNLSAKIQGIKKADSMTDNQVKALVRDFSSPIKWLIILLVSRVETVRIVLGFGSFFIITI